ncbi:unnamed protein product [Chondrus crispus]|uniref:Uncharacterized protein n=1 Tax=Chondrus crispus TaxID=2769 RepID=R7QK39_CHOCR|nr:unnamed protein product [Chondrus crispus]CDF38439.1 unnamed protein product [Chondrus crispus]|eukprot:XP_005718332.1 unnamed protein product [Chondrus crispus]
MRNCFSSRRHSLLTATLVIRAQQLISVLPYLSAPVDTEGLLYSPVPQAKTPSSSLTFLLPFPSSHPPAPVPL